jgi:hypothetical protein
VEAMMGTFITESVPVSLSGAIGDVGNFKLYACDQPNVILYVAKQPTLMMDLQGKPGVAVTTYTEQLPNGAVKIVSGAATLSLNTAPQLDQDSIDQAKARVVALGIGDPAKLRRHSRRLSVVPGQPDRGRCPRVVSGDQDSRPGQRRH